MHLKEDTNTRLSIFWFRRDLRLEDNIALIEALVQSQPVLPIFIFDESIIDELPADDARISFIHKQLQKLNEDLIKLGSGLLVLKGQPEQVFNGLLSKYDISAVYANRDYEPFARKRDAETGAMLNDKGIQLKLLKDQLIFEPHEILKADGLPYTVYTPYKNKWLSAFSNQMLGANTNGNQDNFVKMSFNIPSLEELGFQKSGIEVRPYDLTQLSAYSKNRDVPSVDATSYLSPHLRFGTVSLRDIIRKLELNQEGHATFLNELIWREFFMQILYHFPKVVTNNFKAKYDGIHWLNEEQQFEAWCKGETGYPMVDAGMRQLNETGYMHNRVRMITAGFLCKHLLIDWKWGESYFASKLLDYELASNNGNWQWAAGTGCDAAPYFRIFNPSSQLKKFDPKLIYVRRWIKDFDSTNYPEPIVEHTFARNRALAAYKAGILS